LATFKGIYYTDTRTDQPPLVLVHGYTCDHTDWAAQVAPLESRYRIVAVDLNGHGRSEQSEPSIALMGAQISELVNHLGLNHVVAAGHSMGTRVVAQVAQLATVRGVIFVDGSRGASSEDELTKLKQIRSGSNFEDYARKLFGQMFSDKADAATRERVIARACATDADWALALHNDVAEFDVRELPSTLQSIAGHMQVIQTTTRSPEGLRADLQPGDTTPYTDFVVSQFKSGFARLAVIPNTGHFPQFEEPAALNDLIVEFVDSLS